MPNIILFDDSRRNNLLPLTFTRPVADLRIGILTIREKWEHYFQQVTSTLTVDYLQEQFPVILAQENLFINGSILPNPALLKQITHLQDEEALVDEEVVIAMRASGKRPPLIHKASGQLLPMITDFIHVSVKAKYLKVNHLWDIFAKNGEALVADFELLTNNKISQPVSTSNRLINEGNIFLEEGAKVEGAFLNASQGPIYIGKNAEIMEGSLIRGPFAMCENAVLKLGTKIYGATTLGPYVKVGGEVNNSVIFGYTNKAHDGFLGNSVLGEWCNLGADSNNSNLKNNYGDIKVWNYETNDFQNSGRQFCGLIMGDHSKCGINTMFNTGTVVGVSANIFGGGFPPKFIPSFAWGGADGFNTYDFPKAVSTAKLVYKRRAKDLTGKEERILKTILQKTSSYRNWEK